MYDCVNLLQFYKVLLLDIVKDAISEFAKSPSLILLMIK